MAADGEPGGMLIVSDYPGRDEDVLGRPMVGETGKYLRALIARHYQGPIVFDNALRCSPGRAECDTRELAACRGYLARTLVEAAPRRILAMGSLAIEAVTGRSPAVFSVRRGFAWTSTGIPVFLLPNPVVSLRNRFVKAWLESDVEWALTVNPTPHCATVWASKAEVVVDVDDARIAAEAIRRCSWVAIDCETAGNIWRAVQLLSVALSDGAATWVWGENALRDPGARAVLADLLKGDSLAKVGQNFKFDQHALQRELGVRVGGVIGDCRLLRKQLDTDAKADLATMAELIGMGGHKEEMQEALVAARKEVVKLAKRNATGKRAGSLFGAEFPSLRDDILRSIRPGDDTDTFAYGLVSPSLLERYNARDAFVTANLHDCLEASLDLDDPHIARTYRDIILPASEAVRQVERWGVPVSMEAVGAFHTYLDMLKTEVKARLMQYGMDSPDSNQAVAALLFGKLHLAKPRLTPGGAPSTDRESLELLRGKHPIIDDLLEWRRVAKLDGTYASGMARYLSSDGRIHPNLLIDGAKSGRMSSSEPNLQNLPRSSKPDGCMARGCFVATPGWVLLDADYSQLELRVGAGLSGDSVMIESFKRGEDIHMATARAIARVWGIDPDSVTDEHRAKAKTVNFGLAYGEGDGALAHALGCTLEEAQAIHEAVLGRFAGFAAWCQEQLRTSKKTGVTWSYWNGERARRRNLWRIGDQDDDARGTAERSSWNTPIQGSGHEYLLNSMIRIVSWIRNNGVPAKVCIPVHDSLLMEVQEDALDEVMETARGIMQGWPCGGVPIVVDMKLGKNWGEMKKVTRVG